jgi:hypothetical protein
MPVSFTGFAPWLLLLMLAVSVVHHLMSRRKDA